MSCWGCDTPGSVSEGTLGGATWCFLSEEGGRHARSRIIATSVKALCIGEPNDSKLVCLVVGCLSKWSKSCAVCIRQSVRETAGNGVF